MPIQNYILETMYYSAKKSTGFKDTCFGSSVILDLSMAKAYAL